MEKEIIAYTDGTSLGNPGPGAYASIILYDDKEIILSRGYRYTTNNRMELMAVIESLRFFENNKINNATIFTDSQLITKAIKDKWLDSWIQKGWKTANKKPVLNIDLWKEFIQLLKNKNIRFEWVQGHSGNKYNELCDKIAKQNARNNPNEIDFGYQNIESNLFHK